VRIGLIDGPVATHHPTFADKRLLQIARDTTCTQAGSTACLHGTFVAGMLCASRDSTAPAICPNCTLLIRPVFTELSFGPEQLPETTPQELARAIMECIDHGARIINLSLALAQPSSKAAPVLDDAFSEALRRQVIVVAAAGNQGTIGSSAITRHPWVIPVVACDGYGRPTSASNLGSSIGRRGLRAPGHGITSVTPDGQPVTLGGTSVAVPFVTGAIALLWSEFPRATAAQIKLALAPITPRSSVVPPLLDAAMAWQTLQAHTRTVA
jgi:subtilisin family serine protease